MDTNNVRTVTICDTEPIAMEGVRALLEPKSDLMLIGTESSIGSGLDMVHNLKPSIVIIDKAFGLHAVLEWIQAASDGTAVVVWERR